MKCALLSLFVFGWALVSAQAAPLATHKLWLFGVQYYRVTDWAKANGFTVRWVTKQTVELSKASTRLVLTTDSRRMLINGTPVLLSHAAAAKSGVAYVSVMDVDTALAPILWPPKNPPRTAVKNICIDPGHGGSDTGKREGARSEKTYTLLLAQELAQQLRRSGYTVSLTRSSDVAVDLSRRAALAQRNRADLFISLHFNSAGAGNRTVRGVETYCMTPARASSSNAAGAGSQTGALPGNRNDSRNMLLAYEIHRSLLRATGSEDRGIKRARFQVLRDAQMPAVLVEAGFMTNPAEARNIYDPAWRRKVAQSIVSGIRNYRNIVER